MSSTGIENYNRQGIVSKTEVIDDFFYDIEKTLDQFVDHWQRHRDSPDEIQPEIEGDYRQFSVEEDNLYFEMTAEENTAAAIKLEYRDEQQDSLDHIEGKLQKVWVRRIETVLERGKR